MSAELHAWKPAGEQDLIDVCDKTRPRCPLAHNEQLHWAVLRQQEARQVLSDHSTFSNKVSRHVSVPNGMDPPRHGDYRRIIEPYFGPEPMAEFRPRCQAVINQLSQRLSGEVELITQFAEPLSLQLQCAFMGWPDSLHGPLRDWTARQHAATRNRDSIALKALAETFDGYIGEQLTRRRQQGKDAPNDVTTRLLAERINGRALTHEELVSLIRNWTVGELGTITACVAIVAHYLAAHPHIQQQLKQDPGLRPAAIDEILRIHPPLLSNRRITTKEVKLGDTLLPAGSRLTLLWASINRDEAIFGNPNTFRPLENRPHNLLYGAGIHVCPGAPLARMELELTLDALLNAGMLGLISGKTPVKAQYPAGGFSELWVRVE
ncbi:cytochrome P450 [Oceanimonas smirnovii]|uniref:Cytochrome P450 n=1 Tax=Oceanimonas smirnovii TaxID=264574 RepID=A0ABW7P020_9GAMM